MASIPAAGPVPQPTDPADAGWTWRTVLRHPLPLRVMHWLNLLCMLALVGSGLQVFNAHPALYWGEASHFDTPLFAAAAEAHHVPAMPEVDAGRFPRLAHALEVAPGDDEAIHVHALKVLLEGFRVAFGSKSEK